MQSNLENLEGKAALQKSNPPAGRMVPSEEDQKRFWKKVEKLDYIISKTVETPCWIWFGYREYRGYGDFSYQGINCRPHRFSWIIHFGEIQIDSSHHGICVCHRCDNPFCVNPEHLFLGTQGDNIRDSLSKGRLKPNWKAANMRVRDYYRKGEDHPAVRLTKLQALEILERPKVKGSAKDLALKFGVPYHIVADVSCGKSWKHLRTK